MSPKVNYTAVGIYVVALSFLLAIVVSWLSSEPTKHYTRYLIFMKEAVSGLNEKAAVKFNGVDVGYVDKIRIDADDPQEVKILVKIDQHTPINKGTTATLMAQGITGMTYIGLKAKIPNAPPLEQHAGEPYPVIPSEPSVLVQLNEALRDVTAGLRGMSESFKGLNAGFKLLFTPDNMTAISNILQKTSVASNEFPEAMHKIQGAATGLASVSEQVRATLQNSEGSIRSLDVAIKNLTDQTLPEIFQAAHSLKQTLQNIGTLTVKLKQNPSLILRGTQPLPKGPGE